MRNSSTSCRVFCAGCGPAADRRLALVAVAACCFLCVIGPLASTAAAQEAASLEGGFIRLADARGDESVFHWEDGVFEGERCLVWPAGVLTLPESVAPEEFGAADLLIPFTDALRGAGPDGELLFDDGRYRIDQPLLLRDGRLSLYLAAGELELRDGRIDYAWRPEAEPESRRGQMLILAGVVLAIFILFSRARRYGKS